MTIGPRECRFGYCKNSEPLRHARARAERAERDLSALRRRLEEAAREDDETVAAFRHLFTWVTYGVKTCVVPLDEGQHVLSVLDMARASAGELRGMLREAVDRINRDLASRPHQQWTAEEHETDHWRQQPDVLAALKEPT